MNRNKKHKTTFLLPKNDFWIGMGSVLNIAGSFFDYNASETPTEADAKAIYSDWYNTGEDLKDSTEKIARKHKAELCS